jgi:tetratricopeptide (TPR) repeat protein
MTLDAMRKRSSVMTGIKTDHFEAHSNRGNVLLKLKRTDEALASLEKAITINPDYAEAYCNLGNVLLEIWRTGKALVSFDKAIAIKPDYGLHPVSRTPSLGVMMEPEVGDGEKATRTGVQA